jgi:3-methyladenine DNA glycosylase AlkD
MAVRNAGPQAVGKEASELQQTLRQLGDPAIAAHSQRFFKTGPGQYGEGDRFLGIRIPVLRALLPRYRKMPLAAICEVLRSPWHEERLVALLLMVARFTRSDEDERNEIFTAYLAHTAHINNWDLVDSSAHQIVGAYLAAKDRGLLRTLAGSASLWERRIAIIATFYFIKRNEFADCLAVATLLLGDRQDLIHKAVGWMLREVGKRDQAVAERFLRQHCRAMPRTMLRYAIEKFPEPLRTAYLHNRITAPEG